MVTARNSDGVQVTRNSSFFKSAPGEDEILEESEGECEEIPEVLNQEECEEIPEVLNQEECEEIPEVLNPEAEREETPVRRYPQRERSRPNDFPQRLEISPISPSAVDEIQSKSAENMAKICLECEKELLEVARRSTKSLLRERDYPGLRSLDFMKIIEEMKYLCPTVFNILSAMIQFDCNEDKKTAALALIYSIIMFKRCHELSRIQRVNTVLLAEGNASQELLDRLNKYGLCLEKTMKYTIQEEIGSHFLDQAVELVKQGNRFVFVLDNIDWDVKVHDVRSDKQNRSVHAVATCIVFDRVTSSHLPDNGQQKNLATSDLKQLISLSHEEKRVTRERYKYFLGKILCELFPAFDFLKTVVPEHSPCRYQEEMKRQSVVVPMPVLMKDEKKYNQDHATPPAPPIAAPLIAAPSRPDQPASHTPPVPQAADPLASVKIPCFGDQLTRVRLAGAKDLRAGSHTATDRLDHIYPFRIVDWHSKRSFLKVIFKNLYKNSGREKGTLRYFREKLQRRNVTVDVKHFENCEQLFLSTGKCFAVQALVKFFNMESKDGRPTRNRPPNNIYNSVLDKFIDEYLIMPTPSTVPQIEDEPDTSDEQDFVRNCSLCLLQYFFLILIDFKDAVKEGNGERLATLHKQLLPHFKSAPGFNAYSIEMLINIIQNEVFLSEAEAHQCIWAATVNWKGGIRKNIEIDLLQENRNRDLKKRSRAWVQIKRTRPLIAQADLSGVRKANNNSSHTHSSSSLDEGKILADLCEVKPFDFQPNGRFDSFPDIMADPLVSLDQEEFNKWFARHKRNLLLDAPIAQDEEGED
ncbi:hypothetical protein OS493_012837 [Desmophyllum pertusum]|uniref:DUF6589 domain-containing protein n=1 Tax=Desmophyllum pertusum TaxID=174260 RepID=A0A9W9Z0V9_9CNID|nr:hypothetical protein OS493_012837 [Desmophyllum pertusum]